MFFISFHQTLSMCYLRSFFISPWIHFVVVTFYSTISSLSQFFGTSLVAQMVKRLPTMRETQVWSPDQEDFLEKEIGQPTPVLFPGKSHGQRNLVGYSPLGCKELDTTEQLHFLSFQFLTYIYIYIFVTQTTLYLVSDENYLNLEATHTWENGIKLKRGRLLHSSIHLHFINDFGNSYWGRYYGDW